MENTYYRNIYSVLYDRIKDPTPRIQVLIGPRQVGKSTLARQLAAKLPCPSRLITADAVGTAHGEWLMSHWEAARILARSNIQQGALLVLDEIQKVPQWSEYVKKLWDEDRTNQLPLRVLLLGSSPLMMQSGLSESLAGRFEIVPITHWSYAEMKSAFGYSLEQYIVFGGYPGAHDLISDLFRWSQYILDSIVETAISRDIFLMTRVDKPALFRQLFELGCKYSGKIISLQKIRGQLQDAGNATTLANYLKLLEGAGLIAGIPRYTEQEVRKKASSPKIQVLNNALLTAWDIDTPENLRQDSERWGQLVESAVGAVLLNASRTQKLSVAYWNEGSAEVDFVIKNGKKILGIEVKSGQRKSNLQGLQKFLSQYPHAKTLVVGTGGISLDDFFTTPIENLF